MAVTTLWCLGRVWHHQFSWHVWGVLALSAWAGALVSHSTQAETEQARWRPLGLAAALGLIAALIALRWLPRGLVLAAVPVVGLAIFQALMSLGKKNL